MFSVGFIAGTYRTRGACRGSVQPDVCVARPVRRRLGLTIALAAALLCAGAPPGAAVAQTSAQNTEAEASVRNIVDSFVTAWNANDTSALTALFAPNGSFTSPSGTKAVGAGQIRQSLTQKHSDIYKGTTLAAKTSTITFTQKGQPVAKGSFTLKGVDVIFGVEMSGHGTYTFRFTQVDHKWVIASAQITRQ